MVPSHQKTGWVSICQPQNDYRLEHEPLDFWNEKNTGTKKNIWVVNSYSESHPSRLNILGDFCCTMKDKKNKKRAKKHIQEASQKIPRSRPWEVHCQRVSAQRRHWCHSAWCPQVVLPLESSTCQQWRPDARARGIKIHQFLWYFFAMKKHGKSTVHILLFD